MKSKRNFVVFPDASDVIVEVASLNQGKTTALVAFIHQACWGNNSDSTTSSATGVDDSRLGLLHAPCEAFDQAVAQARVTLAAALPSYMKPSIYLPLVQIPRSRRGKAARGQLRQIVNSGLHERWTGDASTVTIPQRRPKNEMEVILCSAVADVLGLSEAGISAEDSFFRRRGDSVGRSDDVGWKFTGAISPLRTYSSILGWTFWLPKCIERFPQVLSSFRYLSLSLETIQAPIKRLSNKP